LISSKAASAVCRIISRQCLHWDPRPRLQQCYDYCPAVGPLLISAAVPVPAFLTSLFDGFRCFRGFATPGSWFAGAKQQGPQIATSPCNVCAACHLRRAKSRTCLLLVLLLVVWT
jgi:hypothetical protein